MSEVPENFSVNAKIEQYQRNIANRAGNPLPRTGKETPRFFEDGFVRTHNTHNLTRKEEAAPASGRPLGDSNVGAEQFLSSIYREGRRVELSNESLLANASQRFIDPGIHSPTNRMKTPYEFSMVYEAPRVFTKDDLLTLRNNGPLWDGAGEPAESVTFQYVDRTQDENCPGRYFINGKSFFEEAAALYASDPDYLDHPHAWLPEDIKRYAQDVLRFFGGDPQNSSQLEAQIDRYIRALAGSPSQDREIDSIIFTVNGTDFAAYDFVQLVDFLNAALREAGKSDSSQGAVLEDRIKGYADGALEGQQAELLLSSQGNWDTYSTWAAFYGRDTGVFLYT